MSLLGTDELRPQMTPVTAAGKTKEDCLAGVEGSLNCSVGPVICRCGEGRTARSMVLLLVPLASGVPYSYSALGSRLLRQPRDLPNGDADWMRRSMFRAGN